MKLKMQYVAGHISKEDYDRQIRKYMPTAQDNRDALVGYAVIGAVITAIILAYQLWANFIR